MSIKYNESELITNTFPNGDTYKTTSEGISLICRTCGCCNYNKDWYVVNTYLDEWWIYCETCGEEVRREDEIMQMEQEEERTRTIRMLRTGRLTQCGDCGYIWNGQAQCPCWEWTYNESDYDYESEYSVSEDNVSDDEEPLFNPLIYRRDPTSVAEIYQLLSN